MGVVAAGDDPVPDPDRHPVHGRRGAGVVDGTGGDPPGPHRLVEPGCGVVGGHSDRQSVFPTGMGGDQAGEGLDSVGVASMDDHRSLLRQLVDHLLGAGLVAQLPGSAAGSRRRPSTADPEPHGHDYRAREASEPAICLPGHRPQGNTERGTVPLAAPLRDFPATAALLVRTGVPV
jgi:hypothetical protein